MGSEWGSTSLVETPQLELRLDGGQRIGETETAGVMKVAAEGRTGKGIPATLDDFGHLPGISKLVVSG